MQAMKPSAWEAAKDKTLVKPANTTGSDGTTVVIGKADAKKTLEMYEDPRCPICSQFEQTVGPTIQKDVDAGKYKIQFIGATFIDNGSPGVGSKTALSALGAALNVSPEAFLEYKAALYSAKYHPEETKRQVQEPRLPDRDRGHRSRAQGQRGVREGREGRHLRQVGADHVGQVQQERRQGTPTLKMDGKKITDGTSDNAPMDPATYATRSTRPSRADPGRCR